MNKTTIKKTPEVREHALRTFARMNSQFRTAQNRFKAQFEKLKTKPLQLLKGKVGIGVATIDM